MKTLVITAFIICSTLVALAQTSYQIIYRDFEPDTSVALSRTCVGGLPFPLDSLKIDLNSDSVFDVAFYLAGPSCIFSLYYKSINPNVFTNECEAIGDSLSSSGNYWSQYPSMFSSNLFTDKYGIKFIDGQDVYYGWFRAYEIWDEFFAYPFIDKMAFCTIPNYPLLWGQTEIENSVPITESDGAMLYLNYINGESKLDLSSESEILAVEITSANGQLLKKQSVKRANQTEIDVSTLPVGVYVVKATLIDKRVVCAKFVK